MTKIEAKMANITCYFHPEVNGWGAWISETGVAGTWRKIPQKLVSDGDEGPVWAPYSSRKEAKLEALHLWNVIWGADDYEGTSDYFAQAA